MAERLKGVRGLPEYVGEVKKRLAAGEAFANSDILAGVVMLAMKKLGAHVEYFPLRKLFPLWEGHGEVCRERGGVSVADNITVRGDRFEELKEKVESSDGIILVSPVYFGDRSSVANKLLQLSGMHNWLEGKVFGAVSVGAKRNGGQETTIIYILFEALNQKAFIVGNGPPTSQYGGTAVGGMKGAVIDDAVGLETAYGTGQRVAHVSRIVRSGRAGTLGRHARILVMVTMDDTHQVLHSFLEDFIVRAGKRLRGASFHLENVLSSTIYRCIGCDECPSGSKGPPCGDQERRQRSRCIISNPEDAMAAIHELLLAADGIVIAGLNVKQHSQLVYRYQVLIERTRHIRRSDFELTNKLLTSFSLTQVGARVNTLHSLKTMTSYVRHNTIVYKPIEAYLADGKVLDDGMEDFVNFVRSASIIARGRESVEPMSTEYVPTGSGGYGTERPGS